MSMMENLFSQNLCTCGHSISEEHENGKCYALDVIGGNCYKACDCRNIKIMPFNILVKRDANNFSKEDSRRIEEGKDSTTKAIFQWGKAAA